MTNRHRDDGSTLCTFADYFLVECPRCASCARSTRLHTYARVACRKCGYSKETGLGHLAVGGPYDSYFQLPLWLQRPCCGHTLWAHNLEHLAYIESYVRAGHRMRNADPNAPLRNTTMASRFPRWMISAKNRDEVLRAIEVLRSKAS